jgi:hypothetical protein
VDDEGERVLVVLGSNDVELDGDRDNSSRVAGDFSLSARQYYAPASGASRNPAPLYQRSPAIIPHNTYAYLPWLPEKKETKGIESILLL